MVKSKSLTKRGIKRNIKRQMQRKKRVYVIEVGYQEKNVTVIILLL